jgi:uncharacterized membrane protein
MNGTGETSMPKRKAQRTLKSRMDALRAVSIAPHTELGFERIVFFSDAVTAIAITLLALEIRLPEGNLPASELVTALVGLLGRYVSFFISFFVIGLFWLSHHRMFEYIHTYDRTLLLLNLVYLFLVAFIPFPTAVLGRYPLEFASVVFYAGVVILLALVRIIFWWYIFYQAHLVSPETDPRVGWIELIPALITMSVFGVSIVIAFWEPKWAINFWIVIIPIRIFTRFVNH